MRAIPHSNVKELVWKRTHGHRFTALDPVFVLSAKHFSKYVEREYFISILFIVFFFSLVILNQMCEGNFHKSGWASTGQGRQVCPSFQQVRKTLNGYQRPSGPWIPLV